MGARAAIYTRISRDIAGEGLGVKRQEADCRRLATQRGWDVTLVLSDNDVGASTYSKKKRRPGFERLLAAIEAAELDAVVAWDLDRVTRRPAEAERLWGLLETTGSVVLATCAGNVIDSSTGEGLMVARMKAALAAEEARKLSRRARRKALELAENGLPSGQARTFGFDRPRDATGRPIPGALPEPVPEEAELLREAAGRLLAGESLWAIAADWNARGVRPLRAGAWNTTKLRSSLSRPSLAGMRVLRGEVVGEARWDPIIDPATWRRLQRVLEGRSRSQRSPRSYLLSGLVVCDACGSRMVAAPRRRRTGGGRRGVYVWSDELIPGYSCRKPNGGCGSTHIIAAGVEDFVSAAAIKRVSPKRLAEARRRLVAADAREAAVLAEIGDLEERLEQLGIDFADGVLERGAFLAAQRRLGDRLSKARSKLESSTSAEALGSIDDLGARWPGLDFDRRRAILGVLVEEVRIGPGTPGRRGFDPSRVRLRWRI